MRRMVEGIPGVVFAGAHRSDELGLYYGLASCLILPSVSETWGLVVNEAMAAGLPVIVSHRCGCVAELVRPGVNGYVVDPLDVEGMARTMGVMSSTLVDCASMGEASRKIVALYTPETWAYSLADCIERTSAACRAPGLKPARSMTNSFQPENQFG